MMNNETIEGMVAAADGRHAVMVDTKNGHYGWVFVKHPDGMWVSSRKASAAERSAAEHHYNSEAALAKLFGALTGKDKGTMPVCGTCNTVIRPDVLTGTACECIDEPRVAMAVDFPPLPAALSASLRKLMESVAGSPGPKFTISDGRLELLPVPAALTNGSPIQTVDQRNTELLAILDTAKGTLASVRYLLMRYVPDQRWMPTINKNIEAIKAALKGEVSTITNEGNIPAVIGTVVGGDCSDNTVTVQVIGDVPSELWTMGEAATLTPGHLTASTDFDAVLADHKRLVRELDVLLNGEAGAADQASLCDIVAQVRMARKKPGTGALQLLALVPDQVVGRVHHNQDHQQPVRAVLNECGRSLPDNAPLYARPADTLMRYVRAPSRKDPKYHEVWPEIEGGPVFDGVTYCKDLFEALKCYNVIVAETLPEGAIDE